MRVTARWTGFVGGPGYSVFHFKEFEGGAAPVDANAAAAVAKVRAFFDTFKQHLPNVVRIDVMPDVPLIEETNNTMTAVLSGGAPAQVSGSAVSTTKWAAAVGSVVTWRTGVVRNSRRIRGRTFIVPLASSAFDIDGTLVSGALTDFNTAATALRDTTGIADLGVYARPTAPAATDGTWALVTSHSVPDMGAIMTSRRD